MQRLAQYAVYLNIFLVMLGLGVLSPMLKDIQTDLNVSYGAIAWGVGAFAVARLIVDLPAGLAAERYPRALVLLVGSVAVAIGSIVAAMASNLEMFVIARALSGVGSAITSTVGLAVVLDAAAPDQRGRASGLYHSALGGGVFFGPAFGGLLATMGGWRFAMSGAGGAALLSTLILFIVWRAGGLAIVRAERDAGDVEASRGTGFGWVGVVLVAAAPAFLATFAIFFTRGAAQFTLVPLAGRDAAGLTALQLAAVLTAAAGCSTLLGPWVGGLSDRMGRERLLVPGLVVLAVGTVLSTAFTSVTPFLVGVGISAIAAATFSIPASMIVDVVDARSRGAAMGLYRVVGDAALSLGPLIAGVTVDLAGFRAAGLASAVLVFTIVAIGWGPRGLARRTRPVVATDGTA